MLPTQAESPFATSAERPVRQLEQKVRPGSQAVAVIDSEGADAVSTEGTAAVTAV